MIYLRYVTYFLPKWTKRFQPRTYLPLFLTSVGLSLSILPDARAQITQLEQSQSSYVGSIPSGPKAAYVRARLDHNISDNSFEAFNPEITITASFSDQQFNHAGGIQDLKGCFFGGRVNDNSKSVVAQPVWSSLNSISNPTTNMFTSNPVGEMGKGMDVQINHGFNLFTTVEPLHSENRNNDGRYYYSKITLNFSRAVSNPVLHLVGLGEAFTSQNKLGFSTELELENGSDIRLTKLSGSKALKVENNKILNESVAIDELSSSGAVTGSIRVTGRNITTLVFKIYVRGDGRGSSWSAHDKFSGDQWLMAFSMNTPDISGNIYDDGNALKDQKVNPNAGNNNAGTNLEGILHVNLLSNNSIVTTADVGADGGYIFQDIPNPDYTSTYTLVLTNDSRSKKPKLPSDWINTGENIGVPSVAGNDGVVDGQLSIELDNTTKAIANANFGINRIPESDPKTAEARPNPDGKNRVAVPTLTGTDWEDIEYNGDSKTNTIKITSIPATGKGQLYYDDQEVQKNQIIVNYDPALLTVDPADGTMTVSFKYSHRDAADSYSEPAEVLIPFYATYGIAGNVFNDANGMLGTPPNENKVDGPGVHGPDIDEFEDQDQPVYVSLVQGTAILETQPVNENGSYFFSARYTADDYKIVLHTTANGSNTPALPLSGLWVNTGENHGVNKGSDGKADGELAFTIKKEDVANLNFGINKIPKADPQNRSIPTPTVNSPITLDGSKGAPALCGFDKEDKTLGGSGSRVVISRLPENGRLYYGDKEISTLNTVVSEDFSPSLFKMTISSANYSSDNFDYAFVDAAGVQGTSAKYALSWNTPLPVTLAKFEVSKQEQTAAISWNTTSEVNSDYFDVQHSIDGKNWLDIGTVNAAFESTTPLSYSLIHEHPSAGENLYRLKIIDRDGSFAYSRIVQIKFKFDTAVTVYPNPAVNSIWIKLDKPDNFDRIKSVNIVNLAGSVVLSNPMTLKEINIDRIPAGIYVIQLVDTNGAILNKRLTVNK
ncbi:T9SS type A sorting domain-containing protein [Dyadobacter sp. 32]|uniref:T9SS type A sorting domain-containing protein n=1 Tax=Dyadobacter sp. 32 TaxID=538966 RepID=UPI0011EEDE8F